MAGKARIDPANPKLFILRGSHQLYKMADFEYFANHLQIYLEGELMMLDLNREDGADLVLELNEVEAYSDVENYPTTSFNFRDDEKSITLSRSGNVLKQSY